MECLARPSKQHKMYKHNHYDNHAAMIPNDIAIEQLNHALSMQHGLEDKCYSINNNHTTHGLVHQQPLHHGDHHLQDSINNNNNSQNYQHILANTQLNQVGQVNYRLTSKLSTVA